MKDRIKVIIINEELDIRRLNKPVFRNEYQCGILNTKYFFNIE